MRGAPRADIHYVDALTIRPTDVRDDESLAYQTTRFPHCILSRTDLAGGDVAVIDLIPVVNEPGHFARAGLDPKQITSSAYGAVVVRQAERWKIRK
jgi:hypothetical protein